MTSIGSIERYHNTMSTVEAHQNAFGQGDQDDQEIHLIVGHHIHGLATRLAMMAADEPHRWTAEQPPTLSDVHEWCHTVQPAQEVGRDQTMG